MLANHTLYEIIEEVKAIINEECSVWNIQGECVAFTSQELAETLKDVKTFLEKEDVDVYITKKNACFGIRHDEELVYVFAIHNVMDNVEVLGKLCVSRFEHVNQLYERRVDKNRFFQQLLLDNLLLVDVYNQAQKINVDIEAKRMVFVVEPKKPSDSLVLETMKSLYSAGARDYVTSVEEGHIILIKALDKNDDYQEVNEIAKAIVDALCSEAMVDVRVAYGTIIEELKDVSKCYKEASMALDVGRIFYVEKNVLAYNGLGIGRLIHQLPISLCEMFIEEVFHGNAIEQLDKETLATVNSFFDNNLNISETARKMYLHRNTLGYRLDKITRTTGLDVKTFEDALTFKIALMVSDHMKFLRSQE